MPEQHRIDEEQAAEALAQKTERVTEQDGAKVLDKEAKLISMVRRAPVLGKYFDAVRRMICMVRDWFSGDYREVPWTAIATIIAALLYVLSPIDLIPDIIPFVGFLDDAAVVAVCLAGIGADLEKYCKWKRTTGRGCDCPACMV